MIKSIATTELSDGFLSHDLLIYSDNRKLITTFHCMDLNAAIALSNALFAYTNDFEPDGE